jgi:hypothetical protein
MDQRCKEPGEEDVGEILDGWVANSNNHDTLLLVNAQDDLIESKA